jgi:predicted TPR repeat methyltransferase
MHPSFTPQPTQIQLLDAKPGERVFDFDCGSGVADLRDRDATCYRVDLSESMVSHSRFLSSEVI